MTIDSHQHFWRYVAREYDWIDEDLSALRRDFLPGDLAAERRKAGIGASIAVQARQSIGETSWLLALAASNEGIAGVVGWLPLVRAEVGELIGNFAADPRLVGLRHVLQDEADPFFMRRPDFNRGIELATEAGLAYDILVREDQLPEAIALVDRHPETRFILDHAGKPRIREGSLSPWRERLGELARRERVFCKLSGLVTEADHRNWTETGLVPFMEAALEAFGAERLLFGSDWPVCTAACGYDRWAGIVRRFIGGLSPAEAEAIMGGNAAAAYMLKIQGDTR